MPETHPRTQRVLSCLRVAYLICEYRVEMSLKARSALGSASETKRAKVFPNWCGAKCHPLEARVRERFARAPAALRLRYLPPPEWGPRQS